MKNLLSKTLLCGVLASSFLLVNCQKAPNREVKAEVAPTAKPSAAKMGVCTQAVLNEDKTLKEKSDAINIELKKDGALTGDPANALTDLANKYKMQADALTKLIGELTTDDKKTKAEGCEEHEGNDAAKKATGKNLIIGQINSAVLATGKAVKAKTGQENDITKGAVSETLTEKQELKITADLAKILSDDKNASGAVVISNGAIETDAAKGKALLDNKAVTACSVLNITKADLKGDETISILTLKYEKQADATKRNVLNVYFAVKVAADVEVSPGAMNLACNIADSKKEDEAAGEARKALGALVSNVVKALDAAPVIQASGDSSSGSGDGTKASGDATVSSSKKAVATEGIALLDQASLRK